MAADRELFADRLPTYLTRFVGRSRELADVESLLRDARLVTICGVGGAGKTRLAIEAARRWRADVPVAQVFWVSLATIDRPEAVPRVVVAGLDLERGSAGDPSAVVIERLRDQAVLVLIDNCEQVAEACGQFLAPVLSACPGLTVLVTSREPLGAPGERIFPIPPLGARRATPGNGVHSEAADLFVDRATAAAPVYALTEANTAAIGSICERLDGLPLAIELAASWVRVLSVGDLLVEIENGMEMRAAGTASVAARHRSMHAVLDSSWEWLGEEERRVLADLGVFAGGFTREAARAVAGAGLSSLAALVERSLIQRLPNAPSGTRYQVHELVRSYALERLEGDGTDRAESARSRHLDFFLALVGRSDHAWETPSWPAWLDLVRVDQANIDAAMEFALARSDADRALRLAVGLYSFWIFTSIPTYYSTLLDRALALPFQPGGPSSVRTRTGALNVAGFAAVATGDLRLARARFAEDLALCETLDDPVLTAEALRGLAHALMLTGESELAREHLDRSVSVSRRANDLPGIAWSAHDLGEWELARGQLDRAQTNLVEAQRQFSEFGGEIGSYRTDVLLGIIHQTRGEWAAALDRFGRAIDRAVALRFKVRVPVLFEGLAAVAAGLARADLAAQLFGAAERWRDTYGFVRLHYLDAAHRRSVSQAKRQLSTHEWQSGHEQGSRWTTDQALQAAEAGIEELSRALERDAVGLTERERSVLRLLELGLSNDDIAARLVISPRTVHAHLRSIFDKLGVTTRTAAAHEAARLHLT